MEGIESLDKHTAAANQNIRERDYWLNQLSGNLVKSCFPVDFKKAAHYENKMDQVAFRFSGELYSKLMRMSNEYDHMLHMIFVAVLVVLLEKYTGHKDIIVGAPIYKQEIDGVFINTVLTLKNYIEGHMTFRELLLQVNQTVVEANENQNYPINSLLNKLNIPFSEADFPLFDIAILLENIHEKKYLQHINISMIFSFYRTGKCIEGVLEYKSALYQRATIERIVSHFTNIVWDGVFNVVSRVSDIKVLKEEETARILYDFNNTEAEYSEGKTIHELFEEQVEKNPANIAAASGGEKISYQELNIRANRLARALRARGVRNGSFVSVIIDRSLEMILGVMGILKAGGAYVPLEPNLPDARILKILGSLNLECVLTNNSYLQKVLFIANKLPKLKNIFCLDEATNPEVMAVGLLRDNKLILSEQIEANLGENVTPMTTSEDIAYVIHTSGSTGTPKGVVETHKPVINIIEWMNKTFNVVQSDRLLFVASLSFDLSVYDIFGVLAAGASIEVASAADLKEPSRLLEMIFKQSITLWDSAPASLQQLVPFFQIAANHKNKSRLRLVFLSGDWIPVTMPDKLREMFPGVKVIALGGATEATIWSNHYPIGDVDPLWVSIPYGKPIQNSRYYILDPQFRVCPIGVPGDLYIGGKCLASGYINDVELTTVKFLDNPFVQWEKIYKTGDMARWFKDGNIKFLGRKDFQVKIRGFRIELGEIENRLLEYPGIKEAVLVAREDEESGERYLCAYIVSDSEYEAAGIREFLLKELPDYMIPPYFVRLPGIPLTTSGKVDRNSLPLPEITAADEYTAPRNPLEEKLAGIWAEVLGIEKDLVGIDANFFEFGGNSLNATLMVMKIHEELNAKISMAEIFISPTIRELSEYLKGAVKELFMSIKPVEKKEYYALSSAQERLYIMQQMEIYQVSYNIPIALELRGKVDSDRFKQPFGNLIKRHESFRTSFALVEGLPVQRVHDKAAFTMEYYQANREEAEERVTNFIRPFDLNKAPLLRVGLIKIGVDRHILMLDMHHIISDGFSMGIFVKDFMALYKREESPGLRIQYKDFSVWQNELLESGRIEGQEKYWLNKYSGDIPKLNLPTDYPRPIVQSFDGDFYRFNLGGKDTVMFKAMGVEMGATLYMTLHTVFNVLLYKYAGQEDLVVGSDNAGRFHVDLNLVIGMFVNMLAMRNYPRGQMSYREFLAAVKENSLEAFKNQDIQFESLVDKLNLNRDPSRNPLFDVAFVVHDFEHLKEANITTTVEGITFGIYEFENKTSIFDLSLEAMEIDEEISFSFRYCTKLFNRKTIERMAGHFVNIIREVVKKPDIKLAHIRMLNQKERQQVLFQFNDTGKDFVRNKCYHHVFEEQVGKTPGYIAAIDEHRFITYQCLDEKANQLANYLHIGKNIKPDNPVGIRMDRSVDFLVAFLGILKAGGVYVPLDPLLPEERIIRIIEDAGIGIIISRGKLIKSLNRLQWECKPLRSYLSMDSSDVYRENEEDENEWKNKKEVWKYVGETAADDITGGGWITSYTGEPFNKKEMEEYGDNILIKLSPLLHKKMRVLEIGCASGISMYRIAPKVGLYYAIDYSKIIIEKNRERIKQEGQKNIVLECMAAHEIDTINERNFDLVIINSVIQNFAGHNYFRKVIAKSIDLLAEQGLIFVGDIMDQDLKKNCIQEMIDFKEANKGKNYRTKTDFSMELHLARGFFNDLMVEMPQIQEVEFSDKIYTIENELTKFRYDALIKIAKTKKSRVRREKQKEQQDLRATAKYSTAKLKSIPGENPNNLAYVIYTSGTTGQPKGVMIHHLGMVNHLYAKINELSVTGEDIIAQTASVSFDVSVWQFLAGLLKGASAVIIGKDIILEPGEFLQVLQKERITICESVPSLMATFLQVTATEPHRELKYLRWMISTGEPLTVPMLREWYQQYPGTRLLNAYGPTEAADDITHYVINDVPPGNQMSVPIGKTLQNLHIYILDKDLCLCPPGVRGEICVAGIGVGRGYVNDIEKTGTCFISNPYFLEMGKSGNSDYSILYRTGDIGFFREDGNIECLGRIDHQVKVRGNRIELGEIESYLIKHEAIHEVVVIVREDENKNKYLCGYVALKEKIDITDLREYLARQLPDYMIPSHFVVIDGIPLTSSGKVDRKALPEPGFQAGDRVDVPGDETEVRLLEVWAEVLKIEKNSIGIDANFFELGGHSLKATILAAKIHKELDVKVPLPEIFKTPTIRGLAGYIKGTTAFKYYSIEPGEEKEYYSLSSMQRRLYVLQQMEPDGTTYNLPRAAMLEGELARDRFEKSFRELIKRHESLRTSFKMVNEEPVQVIYKEIDFRIEYYDQFSNPHLSIPTPEGFLRPFDLSAAPLLRTALIKLEREKDLLMLDMHHIISDGISGEILVKDFISLYSGGRLPILKLQYKDYAQWQQEEIQREVLKKQQDYWSKEFAGEITVLNMPIDYPRPAVQSFAGNTLRFEIAGKESAGLNKIAGQEGSTMFMVLLAITNIFFSKLSGQEDIVVGTPIAGRNHADLQKIIGMFVNTMALRNYPAGEITFETFIKELKERTLQAFENQSYPFEDLVEKVDVTRDISRNPLFDVMFVLQNFYEAATETPGIPGDSIGGLKVKSHPFQDKTAKFDFIITAVEAEEKLYFSFTYCTRLFKEDTIARFSKYFKTIISRVIENPKKKILEIEIISEEEKNRLLMEFNDTTAGYPSNKILPQLFEDQVEKTPGHIAVLGLDFCVGRGSKHGEGQAGSIKRMKRGDLLQISYQELNKRTNQLAWLLRSRGGRPGTTVGVMIERCVGLVTGILAVLKAGGAYLPVAPDLPRQRISSMLDGTGTRILLSEGKVLDHMSVTSLRKTNEDVIQPLVTPAREQITDFGSLPKPDRTLIDYKKYHQHIGIAMARHTVSIQATRGCPYNCAYCHKIWPKTHVVRSAENIFDEVMQCYQSGVRKFTFVDDIINLDTRNSARFFRKIIKAKLDVNFFFPNGVRTDILTKEYIDLMIEAGTINMAMALESASPRIQKLIKKNLRLERFTENVRYISKKYPHFISEIFMMIGFPTETQEEALLTLELLESIKWIHFPYLFVLKIFPHTDMYDLAVANGVSRESLERSNALAYHEIPETIPFSSGFVRQYQARFMKEYFLNKERLKFVLPHQMKLLTEDELIRKYNSYLPMEIKSFADILEAGELSREDIGSKELIKDENIEEPDFNRKVRKYFPVREKSPEAFRVLLLDTSLLFSEQSNNLLYDMVEEPLGLLYLLTYINEKFKEKVLGRIAKSRVDFDSFEELKTLILDFKPHLIGIRTLSVYKEFFHTVVFQVRQWGIKVPIVAGGPYATSDYELLLQDDNIDLVVLGEGELTLEELIEKMIQNDYKLPGDKILAAINGVTFIKNQDKKRLKEFHRDILLVDRMGEEQEKYSPGNLSGSCKNSDLFYVIYTSGSTGRPKGAGVSHRGFMNLMHWFVTDFSLHHGDRNLLLTSLSFDLTQKNLYASLITGGTLCIPLFNHFDPDALLDEINYNGVTWINCTPSMFYMLVEYEEVGKTKRLSNLRYVFLGGESISIPKLIGWLESKECRAELVNTYGPTECTDICASYRIKEPRRFLQENIPVGKPINNVQLFVLDHNLQLLPNGIAGELVIGGEGVGRGYVDDEALTSQKFIWLSYIDNNSKRLLYRTGDRVKWLKDGNIEFLGRMDYQVKVRGFRVELGEIESCLSENKNVQDAVVVAREDTDGSSYLCAYVVPAAGMSVESVDGEELRNHLSKTLPDYMIPTHFISLGKLPLTSSGKIDRRKLPKPEIKADEGRTPPGNEIEKKLAMIWGEVLNINIPGTDMYPGISIDDDFFELGGHSLKMMKMVSLIHKKFNVKLTMGQVFETPRIRKLAELISGEKIDQYSSITPVEKKEYYALSSAQRRMYIVHKMEPESCSYNIPTTVHLIGQLDPGRLQDTLQELIERHEGLRTTFIMLEDEPVQRIHDEIVLKMEYYDISKVKVEEDEGIGGLAPLPIEPAASNRQPETSFIETFIRPFDLSRAPLIRVGLIKTGKESHLLMTDIHHVISDGVSNNILTKDFMTLYRGEELPGLYLQYTDFSEWQNNLVILGEIERQMNYWLNMFAGEIPVLNLPTDFPRPQVHRFEGSDLSFDIDEELFKKLDHLTKETETTLYMVLLAVLNLLLSKYTGQEDIVIGSPNSGRTHADLENIIGIFVGQLAMRNRPRGDKTFREFLGEVKENALQAYENQDYQFDVLVSRLGLQGNYSRDPLFDVVFAFQDWEIPESLIPGLKIKQYEYEEKTSKTDLRVGVNEMNGIINIKITYTSTLFKRSTIEKMAKRYIDILNQVLENVDVKLADIRIAHQLAMAKSNILQEEKSDFGF